MVLGSARVVLAAGGTGHDGKLAGPDQVYLRPLALTWRLAQRATFCTATGFQRQAPSAIRVIGFMPLSPDQVSGWSGQ
jgi:hypothetical protein